MIFAVVFNSAVINIVNIDASPEAADGVTYIEASEGNLASIRALTNGENYFPAPPILEAPTTAQAVGDYLDSIVFPFIKLTIRTFAAENISMGIVQAGKTGDMIGLYEQQFVIAGTIKPVSLKAAFDSGSLYVAKDVLQHIRETPAEFAGLDPYVSDARLLGLKNQIETFLEITLST
jgi:hypothetical protein